MRIALISLSCPRTGADGIARQRGTLARALARRGHDVHVFTLGARPEATAFDQATIHRDTRPKYPNHWFASLPVLDWPLTDSQLLWELVERQHETLPFDVIDVPLWLAQGAATLERSPAPVVLWLQTTLRHLIDLQDRAPRRHELELLALDARALARASFVLADSQAVLIDVQRVYGTRVDSARSGIAWLGLDDEGGPWSVDRPSRSEVEVLVVGRLEQRKGTLPLLDGLTSMLVIHPRIRVTFVGSDNSASDGFRATTGHTYPEWFARHAPRLADRVTFLGSVADEVLWERYRRADVLLHAARYESFGLVFLEAMRAGLPTVAFDVAAANEIHDRTSARLAPPDDWHRLLAEVAALASDRDARDRLGRAARARFATVFTADLMAERTLDAYHRVVSQPRKTRRTKAPRRIFQVTEALQSPDAIGSIITAQARLLAPLGGVEPIQTVFVQPELAPLTGRITCARFAPRDTVMLHFYGYSRLERLFGELRSRRVLHYHNITPPRYFRPTDPSFEMTVRGLAQLPRMAQHADLITGDSLFNVADVARHLVTPRPTACLYPSIDQASLAAHPVDEDWLAMARERKRREQEIVVLFVGRFARNKRHDLVVAAAARLAGDGRRRVRVVLPGQPGAGSLVRRIRTSEGRHRGLSVELPGVVSSARLYAYYRLADVFLSASEHEGFGMPLAEAMAFGVPVVAAPHGAVPETLGDSGVLLREWSSLQAADEIATLLDYPDHRERVVRRQYANLERFSEDALRRRLQDVVDFLLDGRPSPTIVASDVRLSERTP
jgi:glycosyltransferase involved in cell wall biosynthesis